MKKVVIIWGGFCSGKTSFVMRLANKMMRINDNVDFVCGDNHGYAGITIGEKKKRLTELLKRTQHLVFEGFRAPQGLWRIFMAYIKYSNRLDRPTKIIFIIPLMSSTRMKHVLKVRKKKKGKIWDLKAEKYWTTRVLNYEACERYTNKISKLNSIYIYLKEYVEIRWVLLNSEDFDDFSAWDTEMEYLLKELK